MKYHQYLIDYYFEIKIIIYIYIYTKTVFISKQFKTKQNYDNGKPSIIKLC